jgi:hypothetical protein
MLAPSQRPLRGGSRLTMPTKHTLRQHRPLHGPRPARGGPVAETSIAFRRRYAAAKPSTAHGYARLIAAGFTNPHPAQSGGGSGLVRAATAAASTPFRQADRRDSHSAKASRAGEGIR